MIDRLPHLLRALACAVLLPGCAALAAAAPTLLDASERIIRAELDAAKDADREAELRRALALVAEARAAQRAAEEAAARAEEAAREAQDAVALAQATLAEAEARERWASAQRRLAHALRTLTTR